MMMRTVKPPPKVNPPRPLLHLMENKQVKAHEVMEIPKKETAPSPYDFDEDVREQMRLLEDSIKQMLPEKPLESPRVPMSQSEFERRFEEERKAKPKGPPSEPINLKDWRAKGYPSEYAYAQATGALEIPKPTNHIEPAYHIKIANQQAEVLTAPMQQRSVAQAPPPSSRREELFSREVDNLSGNNSQYGGRVQARREPSSLASHMNYSADAEPFEESREPVPMGVQQRQYPVQSKDNINFPQQRPPQQQNWREPPPQVSGITAKLSQSDREKGQLRAKQQEYARQLANDSSVPKSGSLLDYVNKNNSSPDHNNGYVDNQQARKVNEGLMLGLEAEKAKALKQFKQMQYKEQLDASKRGLAAPNVPEQPDRISLYKPREITPAQSGMMFGLDKNNELAVKRDRQEEYRRELDRMRQEKAPAQSGRNIPPSDYNNKYRQLEDPNSYDPYGSEYSYGGGNVGGGGKSLSNYVGSSGLSPVQRNYVEPTAPVKIGGRKVGNVSAQPDTGMLFGLDKDAEKNSRRAKQEEYRRQLDQSSKVNEKPVRQQSQGAQANIVPPRSQMIPTSNNYAPSSRYDERSSLPPAAAYNNSYYSEDPSAGRMVPSREEEDEMEKLIQERMIIERKKMDLYVQYQQQFDEDNYSDTGSQNRELPPPSYRGGGVGGGGRSLADMYGERREVRDKPTYEHEDRAPLSQPPQAAYKALPVSAAPVVNRYNSPVKSHENSDGLYDNFRNKNNRNNFPGQNESVVDDWRPSGASKPNDAKKAATLAYQAILDEQVKQAQEAKKLQKLKEKEEDEKRMKKEEEELIALKEAERLEAEQKKAAEYKEIMEKQRIANEAAFARKHKNKVDDAVMDIPAPSVASNVKKVSAVESSIDRDRLLDNAEYEYGHFDTEVNQKPKRSQQPRSLGAYVPDFESNDDDYSVRSDDRLPITNKAYDAGYPGASLANYRNMNQPPPIIEEPPPPLSSRYIDESPSKRGNVSPTKAARERLVTDVYGQSNILTGQTDGDYWKPGRGKNKTEREKVAAARQRADLEEQMKANAIKKEAEKREREEELRREREEYQQSLNTDKKSAAAEKEKLKNQNLANEKAREAAELAQLKKMEAAKAEERRRAAEQSDDSYDHRDVGMGLRNSNSNSYNNVRGAPQVVAAPPRTMVTSTDHIESPLRASLQASEEQRYQYQRESDERERFYRLQQQQQLQKSSQRYSNPRYDPAGPLLDLYRPTSAEAVDSFVQNYRKPVNAPPLRRGGGPPNDYSYQQSSYQQRNAYDEVEMSIASESRLVPINPWAGSDILNSLVPVNVSHNNNNNLPPNGYKNVSGYGNPSTSQQSIDLEKSMPANSFMMFQGKRTPGDSKRPEVNQSSDEIPHHSTKVQAVDVSPPVKQKPQPRQPVVKPEPSPQQKRVITHLYEGGRQPTLEELSLLIDETNDMISKEKSLDSNLQKDLDTRYRYDHDDEVLSQSTSVFVDSSTDFATHLSNSGSRGSDGYNLKPSKLMEQNLMEDELTDGPSKNRIYVRPKSGVEIEFTGDVDELA